MNSETISVIVTGILLGLGAWFKTNQDKKHLENKIADNTELTEQVVKQGDQQFDTIRLLRDNDALRQAMAALRIEVDMHRDKDAFMRKDPACVPCIAARQAFIDRRRAHAPVPIVPAMPVEELP